jgi:hypothetical protein
MNPSEDDSRDLDPIVERLERERPVPRAAFRGELRRRLVSRPDARRLWPARPRLLVGVYLSSGTLLLAIAAIGLAGLGPLAA